MMTTVHYQEMRCIRSEMLTKHHQVRSAVHGEVRHQMGLGTIDQAYVAQHRVSKH